MNMNTNFQKTADAGKQLIKQFQQEKKKHYMNGTNDKTGQDMHLKNNQTEKDASEFHCKF